MNVEWSEIPSLVVQEVVLCPPVWVRKLLCSLYLCYYFEIAEWLDLLLLLGRRYNSRNHLIADY